MAHGDFKDLARRRTSDIVLKYKALNTAKNPKYDGYQRGLASMVYNFFDRKSKVLIMKLIKMNNLLKKNTNQFLQN